MKTLNRYIRNGFMLTFVLTLVVVTFVMTIGIVFKVTDLLAKGVSWKPIVWVFLYGLPQAFSLAIPVSTLTACLLFFGRLSADGEVTAMKANGISIWRIVAAPILSATLLSLICLMLNSHVVPECHYLRRKVQSEIGVANPLDFIDVGRFIEDFPGLTIYIEKRDGEELKHLRVFDLRDDSLTREIRAETGSVRLDSSNRSVIVEMRTVRMIETPRHGKPYTGYSDRMPLEVDLPANKGEYKRKTKDFTIPQIVDQLSRLQENHPLLTLKDLEIVQSQLRIEVHKRMALGVACFAFTILGIPLGVRAHRKESSIGVGLSLILVFNFYIFIILADSLEKHPQFHPYLLNWVPVLLSVAIGCILIRRLD